MCPQATNAVWIPWNMLFIAWYEHSKRLAASFLGSSATGAGDHRSDASSATSDSSGTSSSGGGSKSSRSNRGGGGSERGSGGGTGDTLQPTPLEEQPAALHTGATAQRQDLDTLTSRTGRGQASSEAPQVDELPPWVLAVCSAGGTQGAAGWQIGIKYALAAYVNL